MADKKLELLISSLETGKIDNEALINANYVADKMVDGWLKYTSMALNCSQGDATVVGEYLAAQLERIAHNRSQSQKHAVLHFLYGIKESQDKEARVKSYSG